MSHTYTKLLYHIVFSTKQRRPLIGIELRPKLHQYLGRVIRGIGSQALIIGGVADHVHLLINLHQSQALADVMRDLKMSSTKWVNESGTLSSHFEWQRGYGAFTVSQSQMDQVRQYIRHQESHHQRKTYAEEYLALLKAHKISYDEQFVFD